MIILPEIILFKVIDGVLNKLKADTKQHDEQKTFLYRTMKGVSLREFDFYKQAKELLTRELDHPRQLEVRMFFDTERASLPTIHITLPSESEEGNGIGIDQGYESDIIDGVQGKQYVQYNRMFRATYNIVVTSDNTFEVIMIHSLIKHMLLAMMDIIELNGAQDIRMDSDIVPLNVFSRAVTITFEYENAVPSFTEEDFVETLIFTGDPTLNNGSVVI